MRSQALLLIATICLSSCGTVHVAPPPAPPKLPAMDKLPQSELEQSFTLRMRNFLAGKLPEQTAVASH